MIDGESLRIPRIVRVLQASGDARRLRSASGVSLRQAAAAMDVSPSTLSRWERGERRPRGEAAARFVAYIELLTTTDDL